MPPMPLDLHVYYIHFLVSYCASFPLQFISKKHLDKESFHLVGWAMGGTVAGLYAARYPDDLLLLTMAAPASK